MSAVLLWGNTASSQFWVLVTALRNGSNMPILWASSICHLNILSCDVITVLRTDVAVLLLVTSQTYSTGKHCSLSSLLQHGLAKKGCLWWYQLVKCCCLCLMPLISCLVPVYLQKPRCLMSSSSLLLMLGDSRCGLLLTCTFPLKTGSWSEGLLVPPWQQCKVSCECVALFTPYRWLAHGDSYRVNDLKAEVPGSK